MHHIKQHLTLGHIVVLYPLEFGNAENVFVILLYMLGKAFSILSYKYGPLSVASYTFSYIIIIFQRNITSKMVYKKKMIIFAKNAGVHENT